VTEAAAAAVEDGGDVCQPRSAVGKARRLGAWKWRASQQR